jgi:aminoglycoside phosphotransferase (APT) family kinase protein
VKWDNFIACPAESRRKVKFTLKIIDWEAAQLGDPRWDIGSVFSQYLSLWLFSIPITGRDPPERFPELARFPLDRMQPAIAACWSAYRKRAGLDGPRAVEWLLTAVSCAGARLVQTAFEAAQVATHLDSSMVLHLQLAANILGRPREAAVHLLGIRMGPGR